MNIRNLKIESDGTKNVEIRCDEVSFEALVRCARAVPGVVVTDIAHNVLTDDARATIRYKDQVFTLETPFSDYIISAHPPNEAFEEFVDELRAHVVKPWEKLL